MISLRRMPSEAREHLDLSGEYRRAGIVGGFHAAEHMRLAGDSYKGHGQPDKADKIYRKAVEMFLGQIRKLEKLGSAIPGNPYENTVGSCRNGIYKAIAQISEPTPEELSMVESFRARQSGLSGSRRS
ncbi:MAG: hypothetical protein KGH72_03690 [Candidatus Micrarchaeota archaeon]|nr:hypothetical protein [Candidatus Micrarchaeota archaeon]